MKRQQFLIDQGYIFKFYSQAFICRYCESFWNFGFGDEKIYFPLYSERILIIIFSPRQQYIEGG